MEIKDEFNLLKNETNALLQKFKDIDPFQLKSMLDTHKNIINNLEENLRTKLQITINQNLELINQNKTQMVNMQNKINELESK